MAVKENLVLIPGSLCDERVWGNQRRDLADVANIYIPHLHGYNSLVAMAEAVLAEAPENFALAGFSMGGRVALEIWRLAPERITRLALIDASVHPVAEGEAERRRPQIELAKKDGMAALAEWWNPKIVHPSKLEDAEYMALLKDMAMTFSPDDYEKEVQALLNRPDPRGLLGSIDVPVLILAGEQDPLSSPERNRAIAEAIPGARLLLLAGAAHFPTLEQPHEVSSALREWLAA